MFVKCIMFMGGWWKPLEITGAEAEQVIFHSFAYYTWCFYNGISFSHSFLHKYAILDSSGAVGGVGISGESELQDHYHQKYISLFIIIPLTRHSYSCKFFSHCCPYYSSTCVSYHHFFIMCIAKLLMGPVRHQYHRKAVEPLEYVQTFLSISLFSLLCLYWHLPTCLFCPPCESNFVSTITETNNFHETNIKKEGKTLFCVLFSSKTCSIIKYRNPNDCRKIQVTSKTNGYPE